MANARRRFVSGTRRKLIWARNEVTQLGSVPAAGTAVDMLAPFRSAGGDTLGATITRVHLDVHMSWVGVDIANAVTMGIIVDQLQASLGEVPKAGVEPHADWMYWRRVWQTPEHTGLIPGAATAVMTRHVADVRSQRKMEELGENLYLSVDPTLAASQTVNIGLAWSVLLKLP